MGTDHPDCALGHTANEGRHALVRVRVLIRAFSQTSMYLLLALRHACGIPVLYVSLYLIKDQVAPPTRHS
jgi:hypothetical protein